MAKKTTKKDQPQTYSLVSGICLLLYIVSFIGMMMPMIFFPGTILTWLIGLVTAIIAWQKGEEYGKGLMIAWIILSILGILIAIIFFFVMLGIFGVGIASMLNMMR